MKHSWKDSLAEYEAYLKIERSLSENSISAYLADITKLVNFCEDQDNYIYPQDVSYDTLKSFLKYLTLDNERTQSRIISGIRSFFRYMVIEGKIEENPASLIDSPRIGFHLPEVLELEEINMIESEIDLSKPEGHRNKAIIEMLYGCGLRVSELINLKLTDIHADEGFISVIGKGDKQRLVPLNDHLLEQLNFYYSHRRNLKTIVDHNTVFLNRRGKKLTRVMIYSIIKDLASAAGISKNVSPHTFRHSFATHLVKAGADLRAVQEMLGHESIQTTEIYTHIDRQYLKKTITEHHPRSKY